VKRSQKTDLSAVEAAQRLGVGLDYLYGLLWTRKLEGRKVGKQWRIRVEAVLT
jgi:excisionase family DNA binding protein